MSRPTEPGAGSAWPALPVLVLALGAAAIVAALLAAQPVLPGLMVALALVLTAAACALAGALWHRQRAADRLQALGQQHGLLMHLLDTWVWQTDADHRLLRLQPPHGAPSSAWACGPFGGQLLWERFIDAQGALTSRMQAHAELPPTTVHAAAPDAQAVPWSLRGGPCHDAQGRFVGYLGVAAPVVSETAHPPAADGGPRLPTATSTETTVPGALAEHAAFTYTVSHDLRAPLRVVEGFGRILKEDYGAALDRIGNDHLDRMVAAATRMNHMIDALLTLSELSARPLTRQLVDLTQLARHVVEELQRQTPERLAIVHIQPGLQAFGDPTLLRIALDNLLGNAWKYSVHCAQAEIGFEQVERGGRQVFLVRDNGAGFDMRFADRLFGAFQRLHSNSEFQGTGVGLASVQRIVRRHGGEIVAEAAVGRGARFYFTLGD